MDVIYAHFTRFKHSNRERGIHESRKWTSWVLLPMMRVIIRTIDSLKASLFGIGTSILYIHSSFLCFEPSPLPSISIEGKTM